jgi:hypothetical protein
VYVAIGDADAALDTLQQLLTVPSFYFGLQMLQLHPVWDPLRSHPRYRTLIAQSEPHSAPAAKSP